MRLADFIRTHTEAIILEWESFARTFGPAAEHMSPLALRNHIQQILAFIVDDMGGAQTPAEQVTKSHREKPRSLYPTAAEPLATLHHESGFNMDQMMSEYRSLRASVVKLWSANEPEFPLQALLDLTRFHEAVDQAMTESIRDYSRKLDLSRNLFLGILSHDLRNPMGAITISAQLVPKIGPLSTRQAMLLSQIADSAERASGIVTTLLDLTRARLGSGLPIMRERMDMGLIGNKLIDEMRALHPKKVFTLNVSGSLEGNWDKARIGQIFSNLLGNAVQYGFRNAPVAVTIDGDSHCVYVTVHNDGVPISEDAMATLFSSLTRASSDEDLPTGAASVNLGLGLYICKEIIVAHAGKITVTSSERAGTMFTVALPKAVPAV